MGCGLCISGNPYILQGCVCGNLRSARLPKDNLRKDHQKALKELRSLEDEVILPGRQGECDGGGEEE